MADRIEHDWQRWGAAFTTDNRPVVRIADVVKSSLSARCPLKLAAHDVLTSIAKRKDTELFWLRKNYMAAALQWGGHWHGPGAAEAWLWDEVRGVHRSEFLQWWDWTDDPESPFSEANGDPRTLRNAIGMLAAMHYLWTQRVESADDLDKGSVGGIAILKVDAERLFAASDDAAVAEIIAVDARVVPPAGGSWPHVNGAKWTEAEIAAMESMRVNGLSDVEISKVAGCKRQIVGQKINATMASRVVQSSVEQLTKMAA